jgi:hypothetical protein
MVWLDDRREKDTGADAIHEPARTGNRRERAGESLVAVWPAFGNGEINVNEYSETLFGPGN